MSLTKNQKAIFIYLAKKRDFVSPTEIAWDIGGTSKNGIERNSSWASPICKKLVEIGLVERNEKGWYRLSKQGFLVYAKETETVKKK